MTAGLEWNIKIVIIILTMVIEVIGTSKLKNLFVNIDQFKQT